MKSKLSEKDLELLRKNVGEIAPESTEFAYLFPRFDAREDGNENDYVEAHIHDQNENFIESVVVDKSLINKESDNSISIKTGTFLRRAGYDRGRYVVKYNFLRKMAGDFKPILIDGNGLLFDEPIDTSSGGNITIESDGRIFTRGDARKELFLKDNKYFIHEISPSRKEIRLVTQKINNDKYLRDFFNLQKETKRIGTTGTENGYLKFFDPTNAADSGDESSRNIKFINPNAEPFSNQLKGGVLEIPNAFIQYFEKRSQLDGGNLGGGPDSEIYDEPEDVFVPSFFLNLDTEKTETGTVITNRENNKFQKHKKRIESDEVIVSASGREVSMGGIELFSSLLTNNPNFRGLVGNRLPMPSQETLIGLAKNPGVADDRQALDFLFNRYTIKTNKNKRITLTSNSILRNVGRTYRWTLEGYRRERIHDTTLGVKHNYRWKYHNLVKDNVIIETPNGGEVNGLSFTGKADEAQELIFQVVDDRCFIDIQLEIELEGGRRFTEKVFFPRAISTQNTGLDTIGGFE